MSNVNSTSATLATERTISATPQQIFAAFALPEHLAVWWGPNGFTNTFEQCDFVAGGRWALVMHGPDGANYPNESVFREIVPGAKVVIDHVSAPRFRLTVTLTPRGNQTHLTWVQAFESEEVAARVRDVCVSANEQNLDRLEALLKRNSA